MKKFFLFILVLSVLLLTFTACREAADSSDAELSPDAASASESTDTSSNFAIYEGEPFERNGAHEITLPASGEAMQYSPAITVLENERGDRLAITEMYRAEDALYMNMEWKYTNPDKSPTIILLAAGGELFLSLNPVNDPAYGKYSYYLEKYVPAGADDPTTAGHIRDFREYLGDAFREDASYIHVDELAVFKK